MISATLVLLLAAVISAVDIPQKSFFIEDCILYLGNQNMSFDLLWTQEKTRVQNVEGQTVYFSPCPEKEHPRCNGSSLCYHGEYCQAFYNVKDAKIREIDSYLQVVYEATSRRGCGDGKKTVELIHRCSDDSNFQVTDSRANEDGVIEIILNSPLGCPLRNDLSAQNSCWFNSREFIYDFRSLQNMNPPLSALYGDNKKIILNLCGGTSCPHRAAVCQEDLSNGNVETIASGLPFTLSLHRVDPQSLRGQASLLFKPPSRRVEVRLFCDKLLKGSIAQIQKLRVNESTNSFVIDVNSTLACPFEISPCKYTLQKGSYDLSSLRSLTNRRIETNNGGIILLNICQSLNFESGFSCTGGNINVCFKHSGDSTVLATQIDGVNETSSGLQLVLRGSNCSESNKFYTTYINLICSDTEKEPTLRLYQQCEFHIEWYSIAGCPSQHIKAPSGSCVIDHPFFKGVQLNLAHLFDNGPVSVTIPPLRSTYWMNFCPPSDTSCGMANNVSICMLSPNNVSVPSPVGYYPVELVASHGLLQFKSVGAPCRPGFLASQTTVNLKCHFELEDHLNFISEDNCHVVIDWHTRHACPYARKEVPCSVFDADTSLFYDASSLALASLNRVARLNDSVHLEFNICQNVVPVGCTEETDVCLVDKTDPLRPSYRTVGSSEYSRKMTVVNGSFVFLLGEFNGCEKIHRAYSTILTLMCGPKQVKPTVELKNCTFYVQLTAPEVCPTKVPKNTGCKFRDRYDLSNLAGKEWSIQSFKLSVCSPLPDAIANGTSVIVGDLKSHYEIYGLANAPLLLDKQTGSLFLNYTTEGSVYSLVYFTCGVQNAPLNFSPPYRTPSRTSHSFNFSTSYVCRYTTEKNCCPQVPGLCSTNRYHSVDVNGTHVIMGVCESQAVCNGSLTCTEDQSLGRVLKGPTRYSDGSVELEYTKGDACESNKTVEMSTILHLKCSQSAKQGEPQFIELRDGGCQYVFEWVSSLFCSRPHSSNMSSSFAPSDCQTIQKEPRLGFLLRWNQFEFEVASKTTGVRFTVDLCSSALQSVGRPCSRSVCVVAANGSRKLAYTFHDMTPNADNVVLNYFSPNKACKFTVKFLCNSDAYLGAPKLVNETRCDIDVAWETQLLCSSTSFPSTGPSLRRYDFSWFLWTCIVVSTVLVVIAVVIIGLKWRRRNYITCPSAFSSARLDANELSESAEIILASETLKLD